MKVDISMTRKNYSSCFQRSVKYETWCNMCFEMNGEKNREKKEVYAKMNRK